MKSYLFGLFRIFDTLDDATNYSEKTSTFPSNISLVFSPVRGFFF